MLQTHAPSLCDHYIYVLFLFLYQFIDVSVASTAVHVFTVREIFIIYSGDEPIINMIFLQAVIYERLVFFSTLSKLTLT
jgi:hypothetical protein